MSHKRIAMLLDGIETDYHVEMIQGVLRATRAGAINTLVVPGGWLSQTRLPNPHNFVFDWASEAKLDGLVLMAGSLTHRCGLPTFAQWRQRLFGGLPSVGIGPVMEDLPSVSVNDSVGMYEVVTHLIEKHAKRRIAFVRGPSGSVEANQRYEAYQNALSDHDLSVDAKRVFQGEHFDRDDGRSAVEAFFRERNIRISDIDAIACANDDSALGVLEALAQRGVQVPDEIAVVGFDDAPSAQTATPPLTTINQSVEQQGYEAGRMLTDALTRGAELSNSQLEPTLVIRSSCGCQVSSANDSRKVRAERSSGRPLPLVILSRGEAWQAELARAAGGNITGQSRWEMKLLHALSDEMTGRPRAFSQALEGIARRVIRNGGSMEPCNSVLTTLRLLALGSAAHSTEECAQLEDIFQESRMMLAGAALAAYRAAQHSHTHHFRAIITACTRTLHTRTSTELAQALASHLPALGIEAFAVSKLVTSTKGELLLAVLAGAGREVRSASPTILPLSSLGIDAAFEHRAATVITPLEFGDQPQGVACFSWGARDPLVYEQLREVLGAAVAACDPPQQITSFRPSGGSLQPSGRASSPSATTLRPGEGSPGTGSGSPRPKSSSFRSRH